MMLVGSFGMLACFFIIPDNSWFSDEETEIHIEQLQSNKCRINPGLIDSKSRLEFGEMREAI
jgi:hypothetical protein